MTTPWSITAKQLADAGKDNIPKELVPHTNLIYSSPATLAYNSPGAQGFGVKRAGLAVPESVMLLISPACCGRNTTALGREHTLADRFYYLLLDDTEIITGRYLAKVPEAAREIVASRTVPPKAIMLCATCVDALLGTDMARLCKLCEETTGIPAAPCTMYALTREGSLPPMVSVRQSIYSLLRKTTTTNTCNLLGFFTPVESELPELLRDAGFDAVHEISTCATYEKFQEMAGARLNLILHPEARNAANDLAKRLGIPAMELPRLYQIEKIQNLYRILASTGALPLHWQEAMEEAQEALTRFQTSHPHATFAVGEWLNADPFELSLALLRYGFRVSEIYGTVGTANFLYIKKIAALSPETRIFSNLSPSMLFTDTPAQADITIGRDAAYYSPNLPNLPWTAERQPFGFRAVRDLFQELSRL